MWFPDAIESFELFYLIFASQTEHLIDFMDNVKKIKFVSNFFIFKSVNETKMSLFHEN